MHCRIPAGVDDGNAQGGAVELRSLTRAFSRCHECLYEILIENTPYRPVVTCSGLKKTSASIYIGNKRDSVETRLRELIVTGEVKRLRQYVKTVDAAVIRISVAECGVPPRTAS